MTEVSARLRAAREQAGLTIEEISASTKIGVSALRAIERGDFSKLPGDFYTRAFIRTYAREVHLSPDALVEEYDAGVRPAQPPGHETPQPEQRVPPPQRRRSDSGPSLPDPWPQIMAVASNGGVIAVLILVLLVVAARNRTPSTRAPEAGAVATSGAAAPAPTPEATPAPQPGPPPGKLVLDIEASEAIWVTAAADGTRVLYRLLAPGERVSVQARNDMSFRIGNAAAFSYSINGIPGKPLGGPGQVREFQISRDNYRTFLR